MHILQLPQYLVLEIGKIIFINIFKAPHPSILAASSNSFGTPLKYPYIIQMENARLMVLYSSINPTCVSYKP